MRRHQVPPRCPHSVPDSVTARHPALGAAENELCETQPLPAQREEGQTP